MGDVRRRAPSSRQANGLKSGPAGLVNNEDFPPREMRFITFGEPEVLQLISLGGTAERKFDGLVWAVPSTGHRPRGPRRDGSKHSSFRST
jgi:hypothetical protein